MITIVLPTGTDYVFRVFAENKVGPSLTAAELDKPCRAKMPFGKLLNDPLVYTSSLHTLR